MMQIETFTGRNGQSVAVWIESIESHHQLQDTPDNLFLFALEHLSESVIASVLSLTYPLKTITGKNWTWDWVKVKVALRGIEKQIKKYGSGANPAAELATFYLLIGTACQLAFGFGLVVAGVGAIGSIATFRSIQNLEGKVKKLRTKLLVRSMNRTSSLSPLALKVIGDISNNAPSDTWAIDGVARFRPSLELVNELLKMLVPDKETR